MAATTKLVKRTKLLGLNVVYADVTLDNSYATGGYAIGAASLGLTTPPTFVHASGAGGYMFEWDYTNAKLKVLTPVKAVAGTLAASVNAGVTAVTSTAANGAIVTLTGQAAVPAAAGAEVANATDLSAVTVRVKFEGE